MAEGYWRDVALTATACLVVGGTSEDALEFLDAAVTKLSARAEVLRRHSMGRMFSAAEVGLADPDPDGVSGATLLGDARGEMADISESHAAAGRLLDLFGEHRHQREQGQGDEGALLGQRWETLRADTLVHADQALIALRSALAFSEAADDAFAVAQALPSASASSLWDSWTAAAEALARDAYQEVATAQAQVEKMQHAVLVEFFELHMTLKAVEKKQWMALARTVPGTLLLVGSSSALMAHLDSLSLALHGLLSTGAGEQAGSLPDAAIPSNSDHQRPTSSSTRACMELLEAAHLEATRLMVLHADARRTFTLCAPHLGVHGSRLQAWDRHHADTANAAEDILFWMGSLGSALQALDCVAPDWASSSAAECRQAAAVARLLGRTVEDLGRGRGAVERMGRSVVVEGNHVETVLNAY